MVQLPKFRCIFALFIFFMPTFVFAAGDATAYFAAGCFWCAEHDFEQVPGVIRVISGYMGGTVVNPSYEQVSQGGSGHFESVAVIYNPDKVSYKKLLTVFWRNVDPTDSEGQFCDRGNQYRSVIFYRNEEEKKQAEESKANLRQSRQFKQIGTLILKAATFYPAEEYHQNYAKKNPVRYEFYRFQCGRDKRLKEIWD